MIMTLCLKALGMFQRPHHDKCLQSEDQICKQENDRKRPTTSEEKHRVLFSKQKAPTASSTHCVSEALLGVMCFQLMWHWHFKYFAKSLDRFNHSGYFGGKGVTGWFSHAPPPQKKKQRYKFQQLSTLETVYRILNPVLDQTLEAIQRCITTDSHINCLATWAIPQKRTEV